MASCLKVLFLMLLGNQETILNNAGKVESRTGEGAGWNKHFCFKIVIHDFISSAIENMV